MPTSKCPCSKCAPAIAAGLIFGGCTHPEHFSAERIADMIMPAKPIEIGHEEPIAAIRGRGPIMEVTTTASNPSSFIRAEPQFPPDGYVWYSQPASSFVSINSTSQ